MIMSAKYAGQCQCGACFSRGATIDYSRASRRIVACSQCSGKAREPDLARMVDMAYEDSCRDACGPGL